MTSRFRPEPLARSTATTRRRPSKRERSAVILACRSSSGIVPLDVFIGEERNYPKPDGKTSFDKLSSVFLSGNATRDDAPNHIRLQEKVPLELALMWRNMCPAQVYEVPEEELEAAKEHGDLDPKREINLSITPSNCVQCGAITAKGGRLTPPEGGDGPNYQA